ncbi:MAG: TIGR02147 family protein, partial [Chitinispirillaceae bacterium]|nr:TIGR02147 family protein [Chitinispirillaceae bacterium]
MKLHVVFTGNMQYITGMERIEFYTDYRTYLKDYYADRKKQHTYFSYRYFCQKAGIRSPALYKEIVGGQRNLTGRTMEAFIRGMRLTESDAAYFRALVHFNQTNNEQEKVQALERLRGLRRKVRQNIVPLDMYEYFSTWYYPVIRELACQSDWNSDYLLLAKKCIPPIKKSEARKAVTFLLDKGFLKIDTRKHYRQTNPALSTGSEVSSLAIRSYNELMAKRGVEAIRQFPRQRRTAGYPTAPPQIPACSIPAPGSSNML